MYTSEIAFQVREAGPQDRFILEPWLKQSATFHRHLDWRHPLDWLGHPSWWLLEENTHPIAALACPDDPPEIAWLRLFAYSRPISAARAWRILWSQAQESLKASRPQIAAIALESWMEQLLREAHFDLLQRVVVLQWQRQNALQIPREAQSLIRPMRPEDLSAVAQVDWQAFAPPWRHSLSSLRRALDQALLATVLELDGQILGYQITTGHAFGAHLARLAVHPNVQGQGWGKALLAHLFAFLRARHIQQLTVNTQHDNLASLSLYRRMGFERTGEAYPVYVYEWRSSCTIPMP